MSHPFSTPLEAARYLRARGERVINYPRGSKRPTEPAWQDLELDDAQIEARFKSAPNIGWTITRNLIDVDLDNPATERLARYFPDTGLVIGRKSKPISHLFYRATGDVPPFSRFKDPATGNTLLELRTSRNKSGESAGAQTMFATSVHPNGETIDLVRSDEPAEFDGATLERRARWVAAAALVANHWPHGQRTEATFALCGALARAGWTEEQVTRFVEAVCVAAQDEEIEHRLSQNVTRTFKKLRDKDKDVTGFPALTHLIGEKVASQTFNWLELKITAGAPTLDTVAWKPPHDFAGSMSTPEIPCALLPGIYGQMAQEVATAVKVPSGLTVMAILGVLSVCATRAKICVSPKPGWEAPGLLYLLSLMPPSAGKSPAFKPIVGPLETWQEMFAAFNKSGYQANNQRRAAMLREIERLQNAGAKKLSQGQHPVEFQQADQLETVMNAQYPEKVVPRLLTKDTTTEALVKFLQSQDGAGAIISTENIFRTLGGLYGDNGASNTQILLDGYDAAVYTRDRVRDAEVKPFRPQLTMAVAVQSPVLRELAANKNWKGCGLIERFAYFIPTGPARQRDFDDPPISPAIATAYTAEIERLLNAPPAMQTFRMSDVGEITQAVSTVLKFSPDATLLFRRVSKLVSRAKASAEAEQNADWVNYLGKVEERTARIAALLHFAEYQATTTTVISRQTMRRAALLSLKLLRHAFVALDEMNMGPRREDARTVVKKLKAGTIKDVEAQPDLIARTDIGRALNNNREPAELDVVIKILEDRGIIRAAPVPAGARTITKYLVNPYLFKQEAA